MGYCFYTFRSITRGQLALRALQAENLRASLLRTPRALATEGCGYAIRVREDDCAAAERVFARSGVQFQRRFVERNGQYRELRGGGV